MKRERKPTSKPMKHPTWTEWAESLAGKDCRQWNNLTGPQYLENRLWRAFHAGYGAKLERKRKVKA